MLRRQRIPNSELVTHEGRAVRFYDDLVRGRLVAVSFFYARCTGICPRGTENLVEVQRLLGDRLGRDAFMYSVTLTPEQDSPKDLRAYRAAHRVGPGWTFLTGRPAAVEAVRRGLGFTDPDPVVDADRSQHSGLLVYGSEPRDCWGALPVLSQAREIAGAIARVGGFALQSRSGASSGRP
jgi:protein SCO1/2